MELKNIEQNSIKREINNDEENSNLMLKSFDNNLIEPLSPEITTKTNQYKNCFKSFLNISFIGLVFIFIVLLAIGIIILYILSFMKKENFYTFDIPWENSYLNNRNYTNYHFDNGLEVMLIQDVSFDMDGGAIVINKGYYDNPKDEGIATFATILLNKAFYKYDKQLILNNYFGTYGYETKDYFTNFRFEILNAGFKKYLLAFSPVLNPDINSKSFDIYFDNNDYFKEILSIMDSNYRERNLSSEINYRENHLIEYLVYDLKDNINNSDICPEGNSVTISRLDKNDLKNKVIDYINKLINPKNIKIVIFTKFKFLVSSKYMKKAFQYLINKKSNIENENNESFDNYEFKKSQIIYIKLHSYEKNYIKIIYFIDKIRNESYSELWYKVGYLNYIYNILFEKKEGSLYSLLNKDFNIKDIDINFDVLKSKLKFFIIIELNNLDNINDIIFKIYQYMNKILKEAVGEKGKKIQRNRYIELKYIYNQTSRYTEKSFDTKELANNNGENIFRTKYKQLFYFYPYYIPWEVNMTYEDNFKIIENESYYYYRQLTPNNSVIVLGLKNNDIDNITCNDNSYFDLNCSFFKDKGNINTTKYYDIDYIHTTFNSSDFEKYFDINDTFNIDFVKNKYISKHNEIFPILNQTNSSTFNKNQYNVFYFKEDFSVRIPKVFISLNLLHPYLRPLNNDTLTKTIYYFQILEIFSAIKHKANHVLVDAIRAGNEIEFNHNENYLCINILCYEDVAYMIVNEISNIIFNTNWEKTDFISNNKMYKIETIDNFFNFDMYPSRYIGQYYFYSKVKNGLFNIYEFNKTEFDNYYNNYFIENITNNINKLNKFIVNGLIFGYCNYLEAERIVKIFDWKDYEEKIGNISELLIDVNNTIKIENFIKWVKEIKQLNEHDPNNNTEYINKNVINKENKNFGFRYISLSSDIKLENNYMNLSLLETMFHNIINSNNNISNYLINYEMFIFRDIYFYFSLYEPFDKICNPNNDSFIEKLFDQILQEAQIAYKEPVDNIGDRFYYLQKNLELILFKKKSSLVQKGIEELNYRIYNYLNLHPESIIQKYNENKAKKNYQFDDLRNYFINIDKKKTFDVNTLPVNKSQ